MPIGTVKSFNGSKGYGFIAPDGGGADVFVHVSEVKRAGMQSLQQGQRISFETKVDPTRGKTNAADIKLA